jgi:methionyl aminopeptidase
MIPIKTSQEIEKMRRGGHILFLILNELEGMVKPGLATIGLDEAAEAAMSKFKAISAFKGYRGYPANICVSVNEEVVHGIPGPRRLRDGDIVSIDIGIKLDGFYSDMAKTFAVGSIDASRQSLLDATLGSLEEAIKHLKIDRRLSEASCSVQRFVEAKGFSVVRDFVGHGIGIQLHEDPQIPNFKTSESGPLLENGMVLAIEPMINMGTWEIEVLQDGWTAVTKDRKPSAHFEHTIAIWDGEPQVLTK